MRLGSIILAFVGLGIAGASVYGARGYLEDEAQRNLPEAPKIVKVVAAAEPIGFGQVIEQHMLTTIDWPANNLPDGVFTDFKSVTPDKERGARRAKSALTAGEVLLEAKISAHGEKITITQTLGENNRAMAISVNAQTGVGGFVTPGDNVDIVLTQGGGAGLRAITILQNIRIIGVDQVADEQADNPLVARTVTVEVTPEQSQKLALAQRAGTLSLTLRALDDKDDAPLIATRLSDVLLEKSPMPEDEPQPVVKINRGIGQSQEVPVNQTEEVPVN